MSKRGDEAFVNDIKEALTRIENYTKAVDYKAFLKKTIIQDAVVRNYIFCFAFLASFA